MGIWDTLKNLFTRKKRINILIIGLDNSGKSTVVNQLKPKDMSSDIIPTVGHKEEKFKINNLEFTAFDMSGQKTYINEWQRHYNDVDGIIFVVDSNDKIRMGIAKEEFREMLQHESIYRKGIPILLLANKKDYSGALSKEDVSSKMGLKTVKNQPCNIYGSNALTGEGLDESIKWFTDELIRSIENKKT